VTVVVYMPSDWMDVIVATHGVLNSRYLLPSQSRAIPACQSSLIAFQPLCEVVAC
jgi:hypothetical protein